MVSTSNELMDEVLNILHMLDQGEAVVIAGLKDITMKSKLEGLFIHLALKQKNDCYSKPKSLKHDTFLDIFEKMIEQEQIKQKNKQVTKPIRIGPMLPPSISERNKSAFDSQEDDEIIGPALPGTLGYRKPDEKVVEAMEAEQKRIQQKQWDLVRGTKPTEKPASQRETWMTAMPENSSLADAFGANRMKGRQFSNREKQDIDQSWFATPEERNRVEREKQEIELFGYVRNDTPSTIVADETPLPANKTDSSIMPVANPEADNKLRASMAKIRELRGKSLVDRHREKTIQEKKENPMSSASAKWDRERDITVRKQLSGGKVSEIMNNAADMSSRFAAPQMSRQFL